MTTSQDLAKRKRFKSNQSGYKGVLRQGGKWKVHFAIYSETAEGAARAYHRVARLFYGEYASTNFEDEP